MARDLDPQTVALLDALCVGIREYVRAQNVSHPVDVACAALCFVESVYGFVDAWPAGARLEVSRGA